VLITLDTGDTILVENAKAKQVEKAIEDVSADPYPGSGSTTASDWFI